MSESAEAPSNLENEEGRTSSISALGGGPTPGIAYPLKNIHYCGECTMPIEYCEYSGKTEKCRQWLERNLPDMISGGLQVTPSESVPKEDEEKKGHRKRGGKGQSKTEKQPVDTAPSCNQMITVQRAPRGKNKSVTVVRHLAAHGIDLKVASKFFASRFACGSSVTAPDEIVIQGDVKDELLDVIPDKWKQIREEMIDDLGEQKR